jgi:hypothetical protein
LPRIGDETKSPPVEGTSNVWRREPSLSVSVSRTTTRACQSPGASHSSRVRTAGWPFERTVSRAESRTERPDRAGRASTRRSRRRDRSSGAGGSSTARVVATVAWRTSPGKSVATRSGITAESSARPTARTEVRGGEAGDRLAEAVEHDYTCG